MKKLTVFLIAMLFVANVNLATNAFASRGNQMKGSPAAQKAETVAMNGYCPVCITKGKYVQGTSKFSTAYKGKIYHFPGFKQQKAFINDPENYLQNVEEKYKKLKGQAAHKGSDKGSSKGSR